MSLGLPTPDYEWTPEQIVELLKVFAFSKDADNTDDLFWRYDQGRLDFSVLCSDTFYYACSDTEMIDPEDIPDLLAVREEVTAVEKEQDKYKALSVWWPILWAARKRDLRPIKQLCDLAPELDWPEFTAYEKSNQEAEQSQEGSNT